MPADDDPAFDAAEPSDPVDVVYNAALSPEAFDLVIVDEAHRSIYGVWRGALEYFDVYRITTQVTQDGATIEAGATVPVRDRRTRQQRYQTLDDDLAYAASQLDRAVTARSQIRLVLETFRDRLFTEIFPGRSRGPEDADLRQGRQPRRGDRHHRAGGVRQGQRLRREDHLQRPGPQGSAAGLPHVARACGSR